MTTVTAILQAVPERAEELEALLRDTAEHTRQEPGALAYAVGRQDDGRFLVTEWYADRAACEAHFAAPYVTGLLARFPELLLTEAQVEIADTVTGFVR
ncbi:putative quinol monooxygenase [Streptomyces sp. NRRL WC-3742]|uniref:putative quinol monooxygenase n=1 Tax=Streptomyces sp. NRRL WC-3742 TaxID=1463934 RepID=UPI0007C4E721|nr:putative quinol monooxygenase [Streptomyces sp. NRRL WC-3742]